MVPSKGRPPGPDLELVPATAEFLEEMLEKPGLSSFLKEAVQGTIAHQIKVHAPPPWTGYFAREGAEWVGVCAFVDRPANGEVEIAYGTAPGHEGRGIASVMAAWLIARAFVEDEIISVVANTAPEHNASTRILTKLGFVRDGIVQDGDIGEAWHWKRLRG